jgi:hypothetical protein
MNNAESSTGNSDSGSIKMGILVSESFFTTSVEDVCLFNWVKELWRLISVREFSREIFVVEFKRTAEALGTISITT